MWVVRKIDGWLNSITMYRLLLYGLGLVVGLGIGFSAFGWISLSVLGLVISSFILLTVCYGSSWLLSRFFNAQTNYESSLITALILICLLPPTTSLTRGLAIAGVGFIAIASKYIFAIRHKHVFNPVAIAVLVASVAGIVPVTWWVGNPALFLPVVILGLLITRKIRHFTLVSTFIGTALLTLLFVGLLNQQPLLEVFLDAFRSWPLVFFATIMLTEPATMPSDKYYQVLFGVLVGIIFGCQLEIGPFVSTPQFALVIGNLFAFIVSPRVKYQLKLVAKHQLSAQSYDFVFALPKGAKFMFKPGQYVDWTLPHHKVDGRGNRRTFTIASSPTETHVHLGAKFYEPASTYKQTLKAMQAGDTITIGQLAGSFTLPPDPMTKLVFIAGGIGVTPFRSMLKYLVDIKQHRDITLFYLLNDSKEAVYRDVLKEAQHIGLKVVFVFAKAEVPSGWPGYSGALDMKIIAKEVPDYKTRHYYISGPNGMVEHFKSDLRTSGVKSHQITTDYFPGY